MQSRQIIEIHEVREILKHISFDTIVFWDLDNTVLQSKYHLGSDQWFCHLLSLAIQQLGHSNEVINQVIAIYHSVQERILSIPVEHATVKIIFLLHEIGIPQGVVTARGQCLRDATMRQLDEIGIFFRPENMIFCDGKSKADRLDLHIKSGNYRYKHFMMVDDKASHLTGMQELANRIGLRFHGFSYRHLDEKVKAFDMRYANIQLHALKCFLPTETQALITQMNLIQPQEALIDLENFDFYDPDLKRLAQIGEDKMKLAAQSLAEQTSSRAFRM